MPINRIAGECGFSSVVYLAGLFKRQFGMPMRDWRKTAAVVSDRHGAASGVRPRV